MDSGTVRLRDFYAGRSIFITGATGFIGKVLVEKLLRSLPEIEKIYILIRTKRGKTIDQRINALTNTALFETLKKLQPGVIQNKLKAIIGDVCEIGLGMSDADRKLITENVSIIFHGAASVRFDDPLKHAILLNTRGTGEIMKLALETKKLEAYLHISTTYAQMDKPVVGEHLYPAIADWRKAIEIAENVDEHTLNILTEKYIGVLPNTYTFTKALAEHVVYDLGKDRIPSVIFRPSIVISTMKDPVPGWVDNFNGPVGLMVASGKGILRTSYAKPDLRADYIPVDVSVRGLIVAVWQKGITRNLADKLDTTFYNGSNNNMHSITTKEMIDFGKQLIWEAPISNILWFPRGDITNSKLWNYINVLLLHILPAIIVDAILNMMDRKPILLKIQRRIYIANMALQIFITNQWSFLNDNALGLRDKLLPEEQEEYGFDSDTVDIYGYFRNALIYGRKYLLNEDESTIESAKVNLNRMYVLDRVVTAIFYFVLIWIVVYKINVIGLASRIGHNIFESVFTL